MSDQQIGWCCIDPLSRQRLSDSGIATQMVAQTATNQSVNGTILIQDSGKSRPQNGRKLSPAFPCLYFEHARGISGILWLMIFTHHGLQIEMPDDWWTEAGMRGFVPTFTAYRVNQRLFQNAREVPLNEVGPVVRNLGVGIFNDSKEEGSARERVVRILRGFRFDNAIPPVEIVEGQVGYPSRYKLVHGAHRFYCSMAAGFKSVPTIEGFDVNS